MIAFALVAGGCKKGTTEAAAPTTPTTPVSSAPAGNGLEALTADQIHAKAKAALTAAKSFHVNGSGEESGQKLIADVKASGQDLFGSVTIGQAKVELLAVGGQRFMRPNEAFWVTSGAKEAKTIAAVVGTRWVKLSAKDKDMAELFDIANVDGALDPDGKLTKGTGKDIGGTPTVGLVDDGDPGGTLYIAATGEPYPLKLEGKDGSTTTFGEFGATFAEIKAPAAADVLDLDSLQGK